MRRKLLLLLVACMSFSGYAQTQDQTQDQCPNLPQVFSPNAAELGKYGKIPVSYFNGLPNISIPLTELKAKGYTLPIYLTYHAGGNRPDQHPGWVGLGWTLHAGGCINRIVNGMKDELTNYEAEDLLHYSVDYSTGDAGNLYHAKKTQEKDWDNVYLLDSLSNMGYFKEYEPDEFQVCLDGINASFYITGDNEIQIVSDSDADFSIEWSLCDINTYKDYELFPAMFDGNYNIAIETRRYKYISEITLTNHDGVKYLFGRDENAIEFSTERYYLYKRDENSLESLTGWYDPIPILVSTPNTWLLSSIVTPEGEEITFHYEKEKGVNLIKRDIHTNWSYTEIWPTAYLPSGVDSDLIQDESIRSSISFSLLQPSYLDSISCRIGGDTISFSRTRTVEAVYDYTEKELQKRFIDFNSRGLSFNTLRDADHYCQLASITHKGKQISFEYTQSTDTRLHLQSVAFNTAELDNQGGRYSFKYNDQIKFPGYNSKKTDKWDYFNDIYYGGTPFMSMESVRQPSAEKMQLEILTRMNYPTGGYTIFEYEPHSYSKVMRQFPFELRSVESPLDSIAGGLRIKQITDVANTGTSETRVFTYDGRDGRSSGILSGCPKYHADGDGYGTYHFDPNSLAAKEWHYDSLILHGQYLLESELPLASLSQTNGNHVTYSLVTESVIGNGKTVFRYSNHDDALSQDVEPRNYQNFDKMMLVAPFNSRQLFRGHLLSKAVYDKNGRTTRREEYTYHIDTLSAIKSAAVSYACGGWLERVSYVRIYSDYPYLERAIVWTYPVGGGAPPTVELTNYEYNSHRQLVKTVRSNAHSNEETRVSYSGDMCGNYLPYGEMQSKGIYDKPVEQTVLRDGKIVSSSLITYRKDEESKLFVPDKYYESRLNTPISPNSVFWEQYNGRGLSGKQQSVYGAPRMTFDSYDAHGNILSATDEGGRCSHYYWDPSGVNPEASFTGLQRTVQTVQVKDIASEEVNLSNALSKEYTYEFDAEYTGYFSFVMAWPECIAYDMRGVLDGEIAFNYTCNSNKGSKSRSESPKRTPTPDPYVDFPELTPVTELYRGIVTAGHHEFKVIRTGKTQASYGGPVSVFLAGKGSINYPVYHMEQHADNQDTWYYSSEADGRQTKGFYSDTTFTHAIPSGVPYTIDWMERDSDGRWTYHSEVFRGSRSFLGKVIDNVRIYPSAATATNWTWTSTGELRSETDGRGMTTNYEYDGMGRLATVFDTDDNKVASYEYHYDSLLTPAPKSFVKIRQYTDASGSSATESIRYHDGLGRLWRTLNLDAGRDDAGGKIHLCEQTDYDTVGRPYRTWLPFRTDMTICDTLTPLLDHIYLDGEPFSSVEYESSPLDRPVAEYGPGVDWHANGKAIRHEYSTNAANALCKYSADRTNDTTVVVSRDGMVAYQTLSVKSVKNEDGLTLQAFTDLFGRILLERRRSASGDKLDTYYVYDAMGRLAAVLPPALSQMSSISSADLDKYAYLYTYDANGNCTAKKLPGCGWTRYIYDKGNRPVFSQDAENRRMGRWMFSFSDIHGRTCVSGYCEGDMETLKQAVSASNVVATRQGNASGPYMGYSVSGLSLTDPVVLLVSYYDDYSFIDSQVPSGKRSLMNYIAENGLSKWDYVHGLQTGSAERVLGEGVTNDFRWSACYYDKKGNPIQTHTTRTNGGVDVATMEVTFTGKPKGAHISHDHGQSGELNEYYEYTYDSWERPLTVKHRMNENATWTVLSDIKYDGIGRVKSDDRNGIPAMKTSFTYNVRSWTKTITGPGLSESMSYEEGGQWSGNISGINWSAGTGSEEFSDTYGYDGLSRLSNSTRYMTSEPNHKYINEYAYDVQGNIVQSRYKDEIVAGSGLTSIGSSPGFNSRLIEKNFSHDGNRMVSGRIMTGSYDTNRMMSSADTYFQQVAYAYDRNGRLTLSEDQGMTEIQYNAVGYPSYVEMADGGKVENKYTSGGTRLESRRRDADGVMTVMSYEGNEVFENGQRRMLLFDGGYVDFSGDGPRYCWYTKDHLGSVRAVADAEGNVFSTYAYGPYGEDFAAENLAESNQGELGPVTYDGMIPDLDHISVYPGDLHFPGMPGKIDGNNGSIQPTVLYSTAANSDWQPYKFSGKESLTRVGLDLYDFGARMYSPSNMRWMTMDPLCEKYYSVSPYAYCMNNPIRVVDPFGLTTYCVNGEEIMIDDGWSEYMELENYEFALLYYWSFTDPQKYVAKRSEYMDQYGYVDSRGNFVLAASIIVADASKTRSKISEAWGMGSSVVSFALTVKAEFRYSKFFGGWTDSAGQFYYMNVEGGTRNFIKHFNGANRADALKYYNRLKGASRTLGYAGTAVDFMEALTYQGDSQGKLLEWIDVGVDLLGFVPYCGLIPVIWNFGLRSVVEAQMRPSDITLQTTSTSFIQNAP